MANYCGPKVKLSRALGVPIAETQKHVTPKRQNRPGQHGFRRGRTTLYGQQLAEKQKLAYYYNVLDKQMRRYMAKAQSGKRASQVELQEILETRLDNAIRRLRWARTIWQARQMVAHGHFLLNGRRVDLPSHPVNAGDVISVKPRSIKFVKDCAEAGGSMGFAVPEWLTVDESKMQAKVARLPEFDEVRLPFDLDYSKIIEFYTR
jgi:small subunit ribosomal protein S4